LLIPPLGKTVARFTPFFKNLGWSKDYLMLIKAKKAAILWNIKNFKGTIMARYKSMP
jgi:hypothetical protein